MEAYTALWKEFEASRAVHVQSDKELRELLSGAAEPPWDAAAPAHQIRAELLEGGSVLPTALSVLTEALKKSSYVGAHHAALATAFAYDAKPLAFAKHTPQHTPQHTEAALEAQFDQLRERSANTSSSVHSIWKAANSLRALTLTAAPELCSGRLTQPKTLHELAAVYAEAFEATKSRDSGARGAAAQFESLGTALECQLQQHGTSDVLEL